MTAAPDAIEITRIAVQAARNKLATDAVAIDVSEQLAIADIFLVVSGRNEPQVGAIEDAVQDALIEHDEKVIRREGHGANRWILLDYGSVVVHIFHVEDRATYGLERLWKDCPQIELPDEDEQSHESPDVAVGGVL